MFRHDAVTCAVFGVRIAVGTVVYFAYGMRRSRPTTAPDTPSKPASPEE